MGGDAAVALLAVFLLACALSLVCGASLVVGNKNKTTTNKTATGGSRGGSQGGGSGTLPKAPDGWQQVSAMITGKILKTMDCASSSIDDAKRECHATKDCTHVDVWPTLGNYYLKNGNDLPDECKQSKAKCGDGDWKTSGGWGWFHPQRGWGPKAQAIESFIKEIECSSGSTCARDKIINLVSQATLPLDVIPVGDVAGAALGATSAIASAALRTAGMTLEQVLQLGPLAAGLVSKIIAEKQKADVPYENRPYISATDWAAGQGALLGVLCPYHRAGARYVVTSGASPGCSSSSTVQASVQASKKKYDAWKKLYDAWNALPESLGNYNSIDWSQFLNNSANVDMAALKKMGGS